MGSDEFVHCALPLPDGKFLLIGRADSDLVVTRHQHSGEIDLNFGTNGVVKYPILNGQDDGYKATLAADGKILITGYSHNGVDNDITIIRMNQDGSLDTSFNTTGIVAVGFGAHDYGYAVTSMPDGKIVVMGRSGNDIAQVRLLGDSSAFVLSPVMSSLPDDTDTSAAIRVADIQVADAVFTAASVTLSGADSGSFSVVGKSLFLKANVVLDADVKSGYDVVLTFNGGAFDVRGPLVVPYRIGITKVNQSPTDIVLSAAAVLENEPAGTVVGTFTTTDPDQEPTYAYALIVGEGDADNASFAIVGNELRTAAEFDYELKASYSIRVRSTDASDAFVEKVFTIAVTDVNETRSELLLSNAVVPENAAIGTDVGVVSTTLQNISYSIAFSLVEGEGSTDNSLFQFDGDRLKTAAVFDFESQDTYSIRVLATELRDYFEYQVQKVFTITVSNVNEVPTLLTLSPAWVAENADVGTLAGEFTTSDPDAGDTFTYSVVSGEGSADNAAFTIDGHRLQTAAVFDYEAKASYQIRVRSTDAGGLFTERAFTVAVRDVAEPRTFEIPAGSSVIVVEPLAGADRMVIRGGGRVILEAANEFSGGVVVEAGELVVRNAAALGTGTLNVRAGAKVTLDLGGGTVGISDLELAPTARLDVGLGKIAFPAGGYSAETLRGWITAGRNGGAWNGPGISSSNAAATAFRAIGSRILPDGSAIVGFSAVGDANMDGAVNVQDLIALNAGGRYGTTAIDSGWWHGDFNGDGRVNVSDLIALQSSGLYGRGSYMPAPASASLAVASATLTGSEPNGAAKDGNDGAVQASDAPAPSTSPSQQPAGLSELDRIAWSSLALDSPVESSSPSKTNRWKLIAS